MVEFRVKNRKGTIQAQTITDEMTNRLYYIIVLFPGIFFVVSHFLLHMGILPAAVIAAFWLLSFFIAGVLYHRAVVGAAIRRPTGGDLDKPREYGIEEGWLVSRTEDTENRIRLSRASEFIVNPTVSFLICRELGPVVLPFGSGSQRADQRAFLDAIRKEIRDPNQLQ